MMKIFALTGGTGCGKSTVSRILERDFAIPVIEGDEVVKHMLENDVDPALISNILGSDVTTSGVFDRKKFFTALFLDKQKKDRLEKELGHTLWNKLTQIIHRDYAQDRLIIVELATVFEMGIERNFDGVIVTSCPLTTRIERLVAYRNITHEEALKRIGSQDADEDKIKRADFIIDTSGDISDLPVEAGLLVAQLTQALS